MMATLLFHECPLIVIVTGGRYPCPQAMQSGTRSWGVDAPQQLLGGA
jgi:hypothetical protein